MEEGFPLIPARLVTSDGLIAAWAIRDDLYARLPSELSHEQVEAIRESRKREVGFLPVPERARAWSSAKAWYPPEHNQ